MSWRPLLGNRCALALLIMSQPVHVGVLFLSETEACLLVLSAHAWS